MSIKFAQNNSKKQFFLGLLLAGMVILFSGCLAGYMLDEYGVEIEEDEVIIAICPADNGCTIDD